MVQDHPWFVYIIQSTVTGRLYTGITTSLPRRVKEHNESKRGAKATKAGRPWELVWTGGCQNRSEAQKREAAIKKLSRVDKILLCERSR